MFVSQIDSVASLSAAIQARREARGLSQAEFARMAGLSVNTVSRWEQGRFRPKGKAAITFLKDTLDFTQDELDKLFLEWVMRDARSTAPRIEDASFLTRSGLSYHDLLERLLEIDFAAIPQLTPDDGGEAAHWAPIFEAQPHAWRLLAIGDHIIGYWHVLHLKRKVYGKLKSGQMPEGQLRVTDLANWSAAYTGDPAHLFISAIVVEPQHQHPLHGMLLIRSFLTGTERLIADGFAISKLAGVTCSTKTLLGYKLIDINMGLRHRNYRFSQHKMGMRREANCKNSSISTDQVHEASVLNLTKSTRYLNTKLCHLTGDHVRLSRHAGTFCRVSNTRKYRKIERSK